MYRHAPDVSTWVSGLHYVRALVRIPHVAFVLALLLPAVRASAAETPISHDSCNTDLSVPLDAYLCSQGKLAAATAKLKRDLAATVAALPEEKTDYGSLVTKRQLKSAQAAWFSYVEKHCALVAEFPGRAADWHYPVANANFCRIAEIETRLAQLQKWRQCATEGGGGCMP